MIATGRFSTPHGRACFFPPSPTGRHFLMRISLWRKFLGGLQFASNRKRQAWVRNRLHVEVLEDRVVPTTTNIWTDANMNSQSNDPMNWSLGSIPSGTDVARFD